jgi:hypothetical protein
MLYYMYTLNKQEQSMTQITYAGYSRVAGELKFRTAASASRQHQLARLGDTDINIRLLDKPAANKQEALEQVISMYALAEAAVVKFLTAQLGHTATARKPTASTVTAVTDKPYTAQEAACIRAEHNARYAHLSYDRA